MRAAGKPAHDFGGCFLSRKLAEVFLDVLDFERALLEIVLGDAVFHVIGQPCATVITYFTGTGSVPSGSDSATQKIPGST